LKHLERGTENIMNLLSFLPYYFNFGYAKTPKTRIQEPLLYLKGIEMG
jgi:hypothetical protein